jgi:hypothetical protein
VPRYGRIDSDYGKWLRSPAADGPIYMLNLTRYRPAAPYVRTSGMAVNSQEPDGRYAPLGVLAAIGATLCFVADVVASPGNWDRVAVVGYPSRRSFVAMAARLDFRDWHDNKSAGIEQAVVMGTLPTNELPAQSATSRILLETWHGPEPGKVASGPVSAFAVEGTLVGDGRQWSGVRYTEIEPGTALPLYPTRPDYEALLLEPTIERWR